MLVGFVQLPACLKLEKAESGNWLTSDKNDYALFIRLGGLNKHF